MFQTKVVQKSKTHIFCSIKVFWKSSRLWDNMKKILLNWTGHRKRHCIWALHAGNWSYKHKRRICNRYCLSTATIAARTLLNVALIRTLPASLLLNSIFGEVVHMLGMKACGLVKVYIWEFLTSAAEWSELSASFLGCFMPTENARIAQ